MDGGVYRIINDSNNKANLKPNTEYKMQFRIRGYDGAPFTESNVLTFTTLNNPSLSISSRTETSMTLAWNAYGTIDQLQFSKDGGTNWTTQTNPNASSGTYQFTGLTANTSNNYKIKCRYKSGYSTTYPVYTQATASAFSTLDYPKASAGANFTIGNSLSVTLNNPLNRSVDVYLMKSGVTLNANRDNYIAKKANVSGTTVSGFNASDDITRMLNSLPSANSGKYDIVVCYPINTKTNMKTLTTNYTYSVNTSTQKPTFVNTNFDYTDINSTTTNLTKNNKCLIKGYSNVRVDISTKATPSTGTTIASYKSTIGTKTASAEEASGTVSMTLNSIDSKTIQVSAIDARTNSTSASKDAEYVEYVPVKFTSATATRKSNGVSELVTLTFRGEYFKDPFGSAATAVTNTIKSMSYKYRKSDSQTWIDTGVSTLTWTANNGVVTGSIDINGDLGASGFTLSDSFYIQLTMTDELSSVVKADILITSGTPAIAISGSNVAIGQQYDSTVGSKLQVNGTVYANQYKNSKGGQWIKSRDNATVRNTDSNTNEYRPVTSSKTVNGEWSMGIATDGEALCFQYTTDTNYNAGKNDASRWSINTSGQYSGKAATAGTADKAGQVNNILTNPSSGTTYYPFFNTIGTAAGTGTAARSNNGLSYYTLEGTKSATGTGELCLGNSTSSGTAGNKKGQLRMMSEKNGSVYLRPTAGSTTARWVTFPDLGGTVAVNSGIANSSNSWKVVNFGAFKLYFYFYNSNGRSFSGNSWNSWDINLPVTFNTAKMILTTSCQASDNVLRLQCGTWHTATVMRVSWDNRYNNQINNVSINISALLIDFS